MPTPFEELDNRYKNMTGAFKPSASAATQPAPARSASLWDNIRRELSQMRQGSQAAGQFGTDYLTPPPVTPATRPLMRAQQSGFGRDISEGFSAMGRGFGQAFGELNRGPQGRDTAWDRDADRDRRIKMAGMAPPMASGHTAGPQKELPSQAVATEGAGAGMDAPKPGTAMNEPGKSQSTAASRVAAGPRTAPMQVAPQDQALMQPNRPDDLRAKYMKMAGMGLEDREKMLAGMPEGQRPIHTIRGTTEGWWSPGQSREFATLPEALTGVEGRPTLGTEQDREQKGLDRQAGMEKERYKSDSDYNALVKSSQIRAQAVRDSAKISAGAASAKGAGGEDWSYHETPEGVPFILEKKGGNTLPVYLDEPSKAAAVLQNIGATADDIAFGVSVLEHMPREVRNEAFKRLDPARKRVFFEALEARQKKQQK